MSEAKLYDHRYDEARNWIKKKLRKGVSWESILYAIGTDDSDLDDFLKRRVYEDDWPEISIEEWKKLVEDKREEENKRQEIISSSKAGEVTDKKMESPFVIPVDERSSWQLYRKHLKEDSHFEDIAIDNIEDSCIKILRRLRLNTPKEDPIRGLVVGNVQSGKTANMAGLMAMAADSGFNVFIVLSGTIENLRKQTQNRLFEDLNFEGNLTWRQFDHLAKRMADPESRTSSLFLNYSDRRYMTVCLKNKKRLNDLLEWLQSDPNKTEQMKILVIDDEADQASVNTGDIEDESASKAVYQAISNIVFCRDKNARSNSDNSFDHKYAAMNYISYTATPYANCLNDTREESLYPRNFIKSLPLSYQYFGPRQIFGSYDIDSPSLNIVRRISDEDLENIKEIHEGNSDDLPESLQNAILWFICSAAVMRYNNYKKPVSMLVHTSQKQGHHFKIAESIKAWFVNNRNRIPLKCKKIYSVETGKFTKLDFRNTYPNYSLDDSEIWDYPKFDNIEQDVRELSEKISSIFMDDEGELQYFRNIHLCIDNCSNNKVDEEGNHFRLTYPDSKSPNKPDYATAFIVIGGNTLSRGLTLEGLVSTYFLRTVKQADTLMQMGRWFGYRKHYELLPRIWMTEDTQRKFELLADIDEDLRETLVDMAGKGKTPIDFEPVIRTSPKLSWLRLTAKNKSQSEIEADLDFSGDNSQLTVYSTEEEKELQNIETADNFIKSLGSGKKANVGTAYYWENISYSIINNEFLSRLSVPDTSGLFNTLGEFSSWVEENTEKGNITDWNVAVCGNRTDAETPPSKIWEAGSVKIGKITRTARSISGNRINIGVLSSKMDFLCDISEDRLPEDVWKQLNTKNVNFQYKGYRNMAGLDRTPLLILYRIDKNSSPSETGRKGKGDRFKLGVKHDLIGVALVIPGRKSDKNYVKARITTGKEETVEGE